MNITQAKAVVQSAIKDEAFAPRPCPDLLKWLDQVADKLNVGDETAIAQVVQVLGDTVDTPRGRGWAVVFP